MLLVVFAALAGCKQTWPLCDGCVASQRLVYSAVDVPSGCMAWFWLDIAQHSAGLLVGSFAVPADSICLEVDPPWRVSWGL